MLSLSQHPHRRFNPLTGEWLLVSPHRNDRPWQGQVEKSAPEMKASYDPDCYLCPGNARAGGAKNPNYTSTFVFENDFAALRPNTTQESLNEHDLLMAQGEPGMCEVICFSPRHDLSLSNMTAENVGRVVEVWAERWERLGSNSAFNYVQIFENRGAMMGASNPHPHCQVWASAHIPNEPAKEQQRILEHARKHNSCLLCDYIQIEREKKTRVVLENASFVAVVPFWAVWPYETTLLAKAHVSDLVALGRTERHELALMLQSLARLYDRVFETPFPYTMGFHQRPTDGTSHPEWHLHAHFYPPLLRSATIRKFMVGYEMLATPQRDITAESAAERLRQLAATADAGT